MDLRPPEPNEAMQFKEHVLERAKVAGRFEVSPQFFHDVDVSIYRDALAMQGEQTIIQMHSFVMREKVDVQTTKVPFEKYETAPGRDVWIGTRGRQALEALPFAVAAIVSAVCALATSPVYWIAVVCFIAAGVLTWRHNAPYKVHVDGGGVTVRGEVEIDANLWHKFPENTTVYPRELGRAVKWVELGEPRFTFDRDEYRAPSDYPPDVDRG